MVSSASACGRKSTLQNVASRILVLGDEQVGKSAAIVRFTTGRFIQTYSSSTTDWLYKHPLGFDANRNQFKFVELLEQKSIKFNQLNRQAEASKCHSLSSRVALDRAIDEELHEKQQLLNKLNWANAYVIIYAINDSNSFNKAIKYLNLIANEINRSGGVAGSGNSSSSSGSANSGGSCNGSSQALYSANTSKTNRLLNKFSSNAAFKPSLMIPGGTSNTAAESQAHNQHHSVKRPILLLANKTDLDSCEARCVSMQNGRLLAMRHHCLFAEISISRSAKCIKSALMSLIDSISTSELHISKAPSGQLEQTCTQLNYWIPISPIERDYELTIINAGSACQLQQAVSSNLVRTCAPILSYSSSQQVVQSNCQVLKAKRANETDLRLLGSITPGSGGSQSGKTLSSASSTSSGSMSSSASSARASVAHKCYKPQIGMAEVDTLACLEPLKADGLRSSISSVSSSIFSNSSSVHAGTNSQTSTGNSTRKLGDRYANFKSSFRKASLAIVGSRSLAANCRQKSDGSVNAFDKVAAKSPVQSLAVGNSATSQEKLGTKVSDNSVSGRPMTRVSARPANVVGELPVVQAAKNSWIKTKLSSLGSANTLTTNDQEQTPIAPAAVNRFRRPLFKYKSRRKTVAFESPTFSNETGTSRSLAGSSQELAENTLTLGACHVSTPAIEQSPATEASTSTAIMPAATIATKTPANSVVDSTGFGRNTRSGSPLAIATELDKSLFAVCHQEIKASLKESRIVPQQQARQVSSNASICCVASASRPPLPANLIYSQLMFPEAPRKDSRSTLSRASTSGGSFDGDDDDAGLATECDVHDSELETDDQHDLATITSLTLSNRRMALVKQQQQQHQHQRESQRQLQAATIAKSRYQIVRSMRQTLTNLTKSASVAVVVSSQMATTTTKPIKRSFCSPLLNQRKSNCFEPSVLRTNVKQAAIVTAASTTLRPSNTNCAQVAQISQL